MNKEELLQELREISDMYSLPYIEKQYQPIHYACVRYNDIAIKQFQEIERLNNIINELENTIANFIKNHTESYIDWKYDREIYLAESNVLQKLFDNYLDKLKELKDSD